MARITQRNLALKTLDTLLVKTMEHPPSASGRRKTRYFLRIWSFVAGQRYWSRPRSYKPVHYVSVIDDLLGISSDEFQFFWRMSVTEFGRLVDLYKDNDVFQPKGSRPPAEAKYQLAVFLYRLAHGHELKAIKRLFGISSGLLGGLDEI
jgi:hypothetical protein